MTCPLEHDVFAAPHVHTLRVDPPGRFAQTCNILYERRLIERLGGFDERAIAGEDVEVSLRARAVGARVVAAPDAVVNHAVESYTLAGIVRENLKWRHLAYLVARHPEFRRELPLRVFWDTEHLKTTAAVLAAAGARHNRALAALALPWALGAVNRRGPTLRARATAAVELPGQFLRQLAEVIGLAVGGARHRTPIL